ncbi:hypothetical protein IL252_07660 [Halomicrobium sp. IBSBa]|uniref:hypothetical protein n=1 Tax=Halomicrobium sp. IBSBa TaxID=2778916 RepID=UPI001ABFDB81|nr:hypothetical protein [Halomicrobium sp. IBSBa]MBO4247689.1 hypothetical protein [Halomicrobium sp. IBSBa]
MSSPFEEAAADARHRGPSGVTVATLSQFSTTGTIIIYSDRVVPAETMLQPDRSHLEEWASLLGEDVSEELLDDESGTWLPSESKYRGDHAE